MIRSRLGALQIRLLGAFALVAAVAIAAFAALTLWSARGEVNDLVDRQQQATVGNTIGALADAYREAGVWSAADLRPARAVAVSGGALLEVRNAGGKLVLQAGRGLGPGPPAGQHACVRLQPAPAGKAGDVPRRHGDVRRVERLPVPLAR